jgi:hypothetical protein
MRAKARGGKRPGAGRKPGSLGHQAAGLRQAFNRLEEAGKINRDKLVLEAWRIALLRGRDPKLISAKVRAIEVLFDRWFGRPPASLEVTGADGADLMPKGGLPAKVLELVELVARHRKGK